MVRGSTTKGSLGVVPDWHDLALCSEVDPRAFFPEKGESTNEAKRICARCDVQADCLEYAITHDEVHGIWGGLSGRERNKIRKRRNLPPLLVEDAA